MWTESHVDGVAGCSEVGRYFAFGNDAADAEAKESRRRGSVDGSLVERWQRTYKVAAQSLQRLATILVHAPEGYRQQEPGVCRPKRSDISAHAQACITSGHLIPCTGTRQCSICKQVAPAEGCVAWMRSHPCPEPLFACADGRLARFRGGGNVQLSGRVLHWSHNVHWVVHKGCWACLDCGAGGRHKALKLVQQCQPGVGGTQCRRRLGLADARGTGVLPSAHGVGTGHCSNDAVSSSVSGSMQADAAGFHHGGGTGTDSDGQRAMGTASGMEAPTASQRVAALRQRILLKQAEAGCV